MYEKEKEKETKRILCSIFAYAIIFSYASIEKTISLI